MTDGTSLTLGRRLELPPPRPAQGWRVVQPAIDRASHVACLVRDEGPDRIGEYLDRLTVDELYALVVTLAAMTPVDQPAATLLQWVTDGPQTSLFDQP